MVRYFSSQVWCDLALKNSLSKDDSIEVLEDQVWVDELLQGQVNGFERLYTKYSNKIYSFYQRKVKNSELANDLTQQTWEKVYKNIIYFDKNYKFSTWLYSLASNVLIDDIRKKSKLDKALKNLTDEFSRSEVSRSEISETSTDMEVDQILSEVQGLSRELLELRYLKEMSFKDISELKGLSEVNVRKIISRSLKLIKLKKVGE